MASVLLTVPKWPIQITWKKVNLLLSWIRLNILYSPNVSKRFPTDLKSILKDWKKKKIICNQCKADSTISFFGGYLCTFDWSVMSSLIHSWTRKEWTSYQLQICTFKNYWQKPEQFSNVRCKNVHYHFCHSSDNNLHCFFPQPELKTQEIKFHKT